MKIILDPHIHTNSSPDSTLTINQLLSGILAAGINAIAITDHETMEGYKRLKSSLSFKGILLIPGIEISTNVGDLIVLGLENPPISRDPMILIEKVKQEGGLIVAPHPFDESRKSIGNLCAKLGVDLIEAYNGRCSTKANKEAREFATALNIKIIGGSDAHRKEDLGSVINIMECERSIEDILEELKKGCKIVIKRRRDYI
ncbi:MAG: PHP domain-containing protein [Candidatus Methanomethyliaceae archaeon]|nr:PHP domain-containing protein [Candidatus Methanomethyliaceae archaeon]MDW7971502.1 PHP domain-containing protein [Nitrososphaerota archaeon]